MRNICVILTVILIACCASCSYRFLPSTYGYNAGGGLAWQTASITLNADSTFVYEVEGGDVYYTFTTEGKWRRSRNDLILKSYRQSHIEPDYYILDQGSTGCDSIIVDMLRPDSTAIMGAVGLMLHRSDTVFFDVSNVYGPFMAFPKQDFDSIKVSFVGIKDVIITDKDHDYYKILTVEAPYGRYFADEVWKIRGGYLKDTSKDVYHKKNKVS